MKPQKCLVCVEQHKTADCLMFKLLSSSDRQRLIKLVNRCESCLEGGHQTEECAKKKKCIKDQCTKFHHPLMHPDPRHSLDSSNGVEVGDEVNFKWNAISIKTASLFIVPVRICANDKHVDTCALVDSGSSATLIEREIADALDLQGSSGQMSMSGMCGLQKDERSKMVQFSVASRRKPFAISIPRAFVVDKLNLGRGEVDPAALVKTWKHLRGVKMEPTIGQKVQVVLGIDIAGAHEINQTILPPDGLDGPRAIDTPFGWIVVGQIEHPVKLVSKEHREGVTQPVNTLTPTSKIKSKSIYKNFVHSIKKFSNRISNDARKKELN